MAFQKARKEVVGVVAAAELVGAPAKAVATVATEAVNRKAAQAAELGKVKGAAEVAGAPAKAAATAAMEVVSRKVAQAAEPGRVKAVVAACRKEAEPGRVKRAAEAAASGCGKAGAIATEGVRVSTKAGLTVIAPHAPG